MSRAKNLEMQLRSWTPRQPSSRIQERLFGQAVDSGRQKAVPPLRLNWLAPAAAAVVVMFMVFQQQNRSHLGGSTNSTALALIPSNQTVAALGAGVSNDSPLSPTQSFEWTNGGTSTSSISSLSGSKGTN